MREFEAIRAESGDWTLRHISRRVHVHSAIDPVQEANVMAARVLDEGESHVVIIGNGLGYLSDALSKRGQRCTCLEVFSEVSDLCAKFGQNIPELVERSNQVAEVLSELSNDVRVIIAPYVLALRSKLQRELTDYLEGFHVVTQSQRVYRPLIHDNIRKNRELMSQIPHFEIADHLCDKIAVAVGSGPTLAASLPIIREWRDRLLVVAASGAVPILAQQGITSDWVVAMEARSTICDDLGYVDLSSKVLVFPWTHPDAVVRVADRSFVALEEDGVTTSGGSTGLAVADLAAKLSSRALFIVGMDMSDASGEYSAGAQRETGNIPLRVPKFSVMRHAASQWAEGRSNRKLFQLIMPGNTPVRGFTGLFPIEFETELLRDMRSRFAPVGSHA